MRTAVVCVGVDRWHPKGVDRQVQSLKAVGYAGDHLSWKDRYPAGSPTHDQIPYAFKIYAFEEAIRQGYDIAIWADASIWFIQHPQPMIDHIAEKGYFICAGGFSVGSWSTDIALKNMGITREEAFKIPMVVAGFVGFDLRRPEILSFLREWKRYADDGQTFPGPWRINTQEAPQWGTNKVYGHRHDQTVLSTLVWQHKMELALHPCFFAYWTATPKPCVLALAQGM